MGLSMAWKGVNDDQRIFFNSFNINTSNIGNWSPQQLVEGVGTSVGPSLAVFSERLFMAWKGVNDDQRIFFSSFDGNHWAPQQAVPGVGTSFRPSIFPF